jgi:hypothetical protein
VTRQEQLEWEARAARPAAYAAFVSVALGIVGFFMTLAISSPGADTIDSARDIDVERPAFVLAFVLQGIGVAVLAIVFRFLYRATEFRRPEIQRIAWQLGTYGPILLAVVAVVSAFHQLHVVDVVIDALPANRPHAKDLATDEASKGLGVLVTAFGAASALALGSAFILIARNARQAGLLSPFMGVLGMIVGGFFFLGPLIGQVLGPLPIIQWFWLGAVGLVLIDRWPGGRGPAWEAGEAVPWPSAADLRAEAEAERLAERGDDDYDDYDEEPEDEQEREPAAPAHPRSKKRKRKRRR